MEIYHFSSTSNTLLTMLPKIKRLTKKDFQGTPSKVFFRGTYVDVAFLKIVPQKFACVIAKKTIPRADDRNKIRRRVYSCLQKLSIKQEYSFIIYPKKITLTTSFKEIKEEIITAFATLR